MVTWAVLLFVFRWDMYSWKFQRVAPSANYQVSAGLLGPGSSESPVQTIGPRQGCTRTYNVCEVFRKGTSMLGAISAIALAIISAATGAVTGIVMDRYLRSPHPNLSLGSWSCARAVRTSP